MKQTLLKYLNRYTSLNEEEKQAVLEDILVREYKKGTVLLKQGEVPMACFFVLLLSPPHPKSVSERWRLNALN